MNNIKKYIVILGSLFLFSCSKVIQIEPKGKAIPKTLADFEAIMTHDVGTNNSKTGNSEFMTDDVIHPAPGGAPDPDKNAYKWADQIYNLTEPQAVWVKLYNMVYQYNVVLSGCDEIKNESQANIDQVKAEALTSRAFLYFQLVNLYGKDYQKATAATDLAVPFVTDISINAPIPQRSTVQEIYDIMLKDLLWSLDHFTKKTRYVVRADKNTATALLSLVYLFMDNYDEALKYAKLTLENVTPVLLDYNDYTSDDFPSTETLGCEEDMFFRWASYAPRADFSPELVNLFGPYDKRLEIWSTKLGARYTFMSNLGHCNQAITYPHLYLIEAECLARKGMLQDALDIINMLRVKRVMPEGYTELASTDKEQVINWVLEERRRELFFVGYRFFDMRRLNSEGKMPAVKHYDLTGALVATLEPGSPRYVLQIPSLVMSFNPHFEQNP